MPEQVLIGYTPWRNTEKEIDQSSWSPEMLLAYAFIINSQPSEWCKVQADRDALVSLCGDKALEILDATGLVPFNSEPEWVFNVPLAKALEMKKAGTAWGHDEIFRTVDHTGMIQVPTPMGDVMAWVPAGSMPIGTMKEVDYWNTFRATVAEEMAKALAQK